MRVKFYTNVQDSKVSVQAIEVDGDEGTLLRHHTDAIWVLVAVMTDSDSFSVGEPYGQVLAHSCSRFFLRDMIEELKNTDANDLKQGSLVYAAEHYRLPWMDFGTTLSSLHLKKVPIEYVIDAYDLGVYKK